MRYSDGHATRGRASGSRIEELSWHCSMWRTSRSHSRRPTARWKRSGGLSFSLDEGKTLGIVGESGSGKSVSTQTILGLTANAR